MAGRKQHFYIPTLNGVADKIILDVDFPIGGITVNNQTNSVFSVYHGTQSLGVGSVQPDYKATEFTFLKAPLDKQARSVTLSWTGSTVQYDPTHIVVEEEIPDFEFHSNPPNGSAGSASNVYIQNPIPAGTNEIGAVKINAGGTADIAMNGAPISGQALDAGGSNILGWLSQIVKQLKSTLTATITGALPTGTNTIGNVGVNNFPATQTVAGTVTANIGTMGNMAQAMITGISANSQVAITGVAGALTIPTNIRQLVLKNMDSSATIYLGKDGTVTTSGSTGGFPIDPKGVISYDVVPGSTPTIYAIGSTSCTLAIMGVA